MSHGKRHKRVVWPNDKCDGTHKILVTKSNKDAKKRYKEQYDDKFYLFWRVAEDKNSSWTIADWKNGYCTVYEVYGLDEYDNKKYIPVLGEVFKYRKELKIKFLRRLFTKNTYNDRGTYSTQKWGYIPRDKLKYLLTHRKNSTKGRLHDNEFVVYTKLTDWEMHSK